MLWAHNGEHPDPLTLCNEPLTAGAIESRRLRADNTAAEAGKAPARIQEIDIWPVVVKNNIKNSADDQTAHLKLMEYAKKHCTLPMQQFLFKNRAHLPSLLGPTKPTNSPAETASEMLLTALNFCPSSS